MIDFLFSNSHSESHCFMSSEVVKSKGKRLPKVHFFLQKKKIKRHRVDSFHWFHVVVFIQEVVIESALISQYFLFSTETNLNLTSIKFVVTESNSNRTHKDVILM